VVLTLPVTPLGCEVIPPTTFPELARTTLHIDQPSEAVEMRVRAGQIVSGLVLFPVLDDAGAAEQMLELPRAILEFRNDTHQLLATVISDGRGSFSTTIAVDTSE
jgi:hypothetical protein